MPKLVTALVVGLAAQSASAFKVAQPNLKLKVPSFVKAHQAKLNAASDLLKILKEEGLARGRKLGSEDDCAAWMADADNVAAMTSCSVDISGDDPNALMTFCESDCMTDVFEPMGEACEGVEGMESMDMISMMCHPCLMSSTSLSGACGDMEDEEVSPDDVCVGACADAISSMAGDCADFDFSLFDYGSDDGGDVDVMEEMTTAMGAMCSPCGQTMYAISQEGTCPDTEDSTELCNSSTCMQAAANMQEACKDFDMSAFGDDYDYGSPEDTMAQVNDVLGQCVDMGVEVPDAEVPEDMTPDMSDGGSSGSGSSDSPAAAVASFFALVAAF